MRAAGIVQCCFSAGKIGPGIGPGQRGTVRHEADGGFQKSPENQAKPALAGSARNANN
jgi:hypothetical protein